MHTQSTIPDVISQDPSSDPGRAPRRSVAPGSYDALSGRDQVVGLGLLPDWLTKEQPRSRQPKSRPAAGKSPRAGVYGRISTMHQRETAIDRQVVDGEDYAEAQGFTVHHRWVDHGKSGAYWHGRDGIMDAVEAARAGEIDVLILEDVDRLGRDFGIIGTVYRELCDLDVTIHGTKKGRKLDAVDIALLGLSAVEGRSLLLERLRDGKQKMVAEKRSPNGRCFGYNSVSGHPGLLTINEDQATEIRTMFELRADGMSHRHIAFALNARGVRAPASANWQGSSVKQVLQNSRYVGELVYGRTSNKKSFKTGKIVSKKKHPREWLRADVPEWAIVDRATWEAVRELDRAATARGRGPGYLLSQRAKCHLCGGNLGVRSGRASTARLQCLAYTARRTCSNDRLYRLDRVESATLAILRRHLNDPLLEAEYATAYEESLDRQARRLQDDRSRLSARHSWLVDRVKDTFDPGKCEGLSADAAAAARAAFSGELSDVEEKLAGLPVVTRVSRPAPERLQRLRAAFDDAFATCPFVAEDEAGRRLMTLFRQLVQSVTVVPDPNGLGFHVVVQSHLQSLVQGTEAEMDQVEEPLAIQSEWRCGRTRGRLQNGLVDDMLRAAEGGVYRLTDAQWELVAPHVPDPVMNPRGAHRNARLPADLRQVMDALFFAMRTGIPWIQLPSCFGDRKSNLAAIQRLIYHGGWEKIAGVLQEKDPQCLEGIDVHALKHYRRVGQRNGMKFQCHD